MHRLQPPWMVDPALFVRVFTDAVPVDNIRPASVQANASLFAEQAKYADDGNALTPSAGEQSEWDQSPPSDIMQSSGKYVQFDGLDSESADGALTGDNGWFLTLN